MCKQYCITDFGATTGGTLCTASIQKAIDECFLQGGGEVVIPEGEFLTGGLRLRSNVTLHLLKNAVLLGSKDPEDYVGYIDDTIEPISMEEREQKVYSARPEANGSSVFPYSRWNNAIIRAIKATNIAIIGEEGSCISGQNCYDAQGEEQYRGPHGVNMWFCENVTFRGYTMKDTGNWSHAIQNSKNITAKNVTVLAGHDGLDFRTCDDITIEGCTLTTGDDSIAGFDNLNVTVRDCYMESACTLMRFGGTNVLVENCRSTAPVTYGFRNWLSDEEKRTGAPTNEKCRHTNHGVLLYYCDNRAEIRNAPGNIVIRNSYFKNPNTVMRHPFGHRWCCNRALADVLFENCIFDGISLTSDLTSPEDQPLAFKMKDCTVIGREGFEDVTFITAKNVGSIELENVKFQNLTAPKIISETAINIIIK